MILHAIPNDVADIKFDFMENLPLPYTPIQKIFSLQLWDHSFARKSLKIGKSIFYIYDKDITNTGGNKVCSMLLFSFKIILNHILINYIALGIYMIFHVHNDSVKKWTIMVEDFTDVTVKDSFILIFF